MSSKLDVILDEQKFPYLGMTKEERNYYINIIKNCKDICDTENKVDNISKCEIITLQFEKNNDVVKFDGALTIGEGKENRYIVGQIFLNKDKIRVDMEISRLTVKCKNKVYRVFDEFTLENGVLKRSSLYNYNFKKICDEINNEEMKGKLK